MTHKTIEMMAVHFQLQEVTEEKDFPKRDWIELNVEKDPG